MFENVSTPLATLLDADIAVGKVQVSSAVHVSDPANASTRALLLPAKIAWRVLQKKLGFRMLMDVIPLDAGLVKGSHGRLPQRVEDGPMLISNRKDLAIGRLPMTGVRDLILRHW